MKKYLMLFLLALPVLVSGQWNSNIVNKENWWTATQHFDSLYVEVTIIDYVDVEVIEADTLILETTGTASYFLSTADGVIMANINGVDTWSLKAGSFASNTAGGAYLKYSGVSHTAPSLVPHNSYLTTGIGGSQDTLNLIVAGNNVFELRTASADLNVSLNMDKLEFPEATGAQSYVLVNLPVNAADGAEAKYFFQIDGNNVFTIEGTADGAGGVDEFSVRVLPGAVPTAPDEGQICITTTGDSMGVYLASGWKWFIAGE